MDGRRVRSSECCFAVVLGVAAALLGAPAASGSEHRRVVLLSTSGDHSRDDALCPPSPGCDAWYEANSEDGLRAFFRTAARLTPDDVDREFDIFERVGGDTRLVTTGPTTTPDVYPRFAGISPDGMHAFFETSERLVPQDTDWREDVYDRTGGRTVLVSEGPSGGIGDYDARYAGTSHDGSRAFFSTLERITPDDADGRPDVYVRSGSSIERLSQGPVGGNGDYDAAASARSEDGRVVFISTDERLTSDDTDQETDIYRRAGGATTLVSTRTRTATGSYDADLAAVSPDGSRVLYETWEQLSAADTTPFSNDLYEWSSEGVRMVSTGPAWTGRSQSFGFPRFSRDGAGIGFETDEPLLPQDRDMELDVYERRGDRLSLVSAGPVGGNGPHRAVLNAISDDGTRILFSTSERLTEDDRTSSEYPDRAFADVYERSFGSTKLISRGAPRDSEEGEIFLAASADVGRVFFAAVGGPVYERSADTTRLVALGASYSQFGGISLYGGRVIFDSSVRMAGDTDPDWHDVFGAGLHGFTGDPLRVPVVGRPMPGENWGSPSDGSDQPPTIRALTVPGRRIRLGRGLPRLVPPTSRHATIRLRVSSSALVTLTFERRTMGRRVRGRCRPASRSRRGPRCVHWGRAGQLNYVVPGGEVGVLFAGRLSRRRALASGTYRLSAEASGDDRARSNVRRTSFRLVGAGAR